MSSENHVWVCPECDYTTDWDLVDLVRRGEPVCPYCDIDLEWEEDNND